MLASATEYIESAASTRCTGNLLLAFSRSLSKEALRDEAKAEVLELRGFDLNEKNVLHPLVLDRLKKALSMR